jgi:hypothetical protein
LCAERNFTSDRRERPLDRIGRFGVCPVLEAVRLPFKRIHGEQVGRAVEVDEERGGRRRIVDPAPIPERRNGIGGRWRGQCQTHRKCAQVAGEAVDEGVLHDASEKI